MSNLLWLIYGIFICYDPEPLYARVTYMLISFKCTVIYRVFQTFALMWVQYGFILYQKVFCLFFKENIHFWLYWVLVATHGILQLFLARKLAFLYFNYSCRIFFLYLLICCCLLISILLYNIPWAFSHVLRYRFTSFSCVFAQTYFISLNCVFCLNVYKSKDLLMGDYSGLLSGPEMPSQMSSQREGRGLLQWLNG